jgi:hypothetical protein
MRSSTLFTLSLRSARTISRLNIRLLSTATTARPRLQQSAKQYDAIRLFSSSKKEVDSAKEEKPPKKGLFAKMKDLWKEYGYKGNLYDACNACLRFKFFCIYFILVPRIV